MVKKNKVEKFVDLTTKIESKEFVESFISISSMIKTEVRIYINLSTNKKQKYIFLQKTQKQQMTKYQKMIKILKKLNNFIMISIDRKNLHYVEKHESIYKKIMILKIRLTSTNRIRKMKMIKNYKKFLKISKTQNLDQ